MASGDYLGGRTTVTVTDGTGRWELAPKPLSYTLTFNEPEVEEPEEITPPKCYTCGKEVESVCSYVKGNSLIVILNCHGDERRIDISLKRFKGDKVDAIEWFSDTFQWVFEEESKWRRVKPDLKVSTVHADRKIISDWLDNI